MTEVGLGGWVPTWLPTAWGAATGGAGGFSLPTDTTTFVWGWLPDELAFTFMLPSTHLASGRSKNSSRHTSIAMTKQEVADFIEAI